MTGMGGEGIVFWPGPATDAGAIWLGRTSGMAGNDVSWGQVELDTQIQLFFFFSWKSWRLGRAGQRRRQAARPCHMALGLGVLPQAWTENADTRRLPLLEGRSRTQTWTLCTAPPYSMAHPPPFNSSPSTPTPRRARGWPFKSPAPTPSHLA